MTYTNSSGFCGAMDVRLPYLYYFTECSDSRVCSMRESILVRPNGRSDIRFHQLSLLQLIIGVWGSATCIHMASTARFEWKEIMKTDVGYDANVLVSYIASIIASRPDGNQLAKAWGPINAICGSLIAACMTYSVSPTSRRYPPATTL